MSSIEIINKGMEALIRKFYSGFAAKDAEMMVSCYHPDIVFYDPAFGKLVGKDACDMWRMLCRNAKDFELNCDFVAADHEKGVAKWVADYTFNKTGRRVHNVVMAKFRFKDGLIIEHSDSFNFYTWAKQAFGLTGKLFGKSRFFKDQIRKSTRALLLKFQGQ